MKNQTPYHNTKKYFLSLATCLSVLLAPVALKGSETDNYLAWDKEIQDSTSEINSFYNGLIRKSLRTVSKRPFLRNKCERVAFWIGKNIVKASQKYTDHWVKKNKNIDQFLNLAQRNGIIFKIQFIKKSS